MAGPPTELSAFLARYDEGMRSLTLGLRAIVLQELASCHEYIFEMRSKIVLLYGASERVRRHLQHWCISQTRDADLR